MLSPVKRTTFLGVLWEFNHNAGVLLPACMNQSLPLWQHQVRPGYAAINFFFPLGNSLLVIRVMCRCIRALSLWKTLVLPNVPHLGHVTVASPPWLISPSRLGCGLEGQPRVGLADNTGIVSYIFWIPDMRPSASRKGYAQMLHALYLWESHDYHNGHLLHKLRCGFGWLSSQQSLGGCHLYGI